jgi:hypothetical protein
MDFQAENAPCPAMPPKVKSPGACATRASRNYCGSDYSETALSTSTVTPGPMVEDSAIFFM